MTPTAPSLLSTSVLPDDAEKATLVGRAWNPLVGGPIVILVRGGLAFDITAEHSTMSALIDAVAEGRFVLPDAGIAPFAAFDDLVANTDETRRDDARPWLLSPIDLQAVKAAGVTFAVSMLERVIEERAGGSADAAAGIREVVLTALGGSLTSLVPGSAAAQRLKKALQEEGVWSQYLEVGIGPDAEIFTKAQTLSTVGTGMSAGIHSGSEWNNPEPEVAVVVSSDGQVVGATLANDVNLRDFEGRSALLLSKAKDNNASAAVGPLIRLFDEGFGLADVEQLEVTLRIEGAEGFELTATSSQAESSRTVRALVEQLMGAHHQYPDGAVLLLGTMFAPTQDRFHEGGGFTHRPDDIVRISTPRLGALVNRIRHSEDCPPWTFGMRALMENLARRGLLR